MAVIPGTPTKPIDSASEMESVEHRNDDENLGVSKPKRSRNRDPGVRKVGKRIYDPKNGKTCHQCRQKTTDLAVKCKNIRGNKPCPLQFCQPCLANRYGQQAAAVIELENWTCPKCLGVCNCSLCLKRQGHKPTGILIHTAKANGYSSVLELLQAAGPVVLNSERSPRVDGSSPKKKAASEMVESKLSSSPSHDERSKEAQDGAVNGVTPNIMMPVGAELTTAGCIELPEEQDGAIDYVTPDIMMPVGAELTTVGGIEMPPENVGKALQFLEFCTVFGEILEVKKGQPECMLRDLIDGRSSRPGRCSLTTQFHIRLISLIQEDRGQGSSDLSPTHGKASWVHALKECFSGSDCGSKLQLLEHLDKEANGYENLNSSDKLMILNALCDEVLGTVWIRSWIDDQNSEHTEKAKEQKERIHSAKDKEKHLKQKMQEEVAKAIMERNGAPLSISEHKALISQIKLEAAQAHTEKLESTIKFKNRNRTSEAVRTESIHFDSKGHVYWRLKCMSDSSQMLVQDAGTENTATEDKWFSLDNEQNEVVEKHVNKFRRKRRRVAKVIPIQPCGNSVALPGN